MTTNIGATNSSNIDAQLAAKRAEEERKRAQAAKLEAEQKAKAEAQKAQAEASSAAQKSKAEGSAKLKADDVSIYTTVETSQEAEAKPALTKTTTPLTCGKSVSIYQLPSSVFDEDASVDVFETASKINKVNPIDPFGGDLDEATTALSYTEIFERNVDVNSNENGCIENSETLKQELLDSMLDGKNVDSFESFVSIYKELDKGSIHSEEFLKTVWNRDKVEFFKLVDENAEFSAKYIAEAFKKNPKLKDELLDNFEKLPAGMQRGYIKMLDNPEMAGEITSEIKEKLYILLTSDKVSIDTRFYAIATVFQSKNYDEASKLELAEKLKSDEVLSSLEKLTKGASSEDIVKLVAYVRKIQNQMKANTNTTLSTETNEAIGTTVGVVTVSANSSEDVAQRANAVIESGVLDNDAALQGCTEGICNSNDPEKAVDAAETLCNSCGKTHNHERICEAFSNALKKNANVDDPKKQEVIGAVAAAVAGSGKTPKDCADTTKEFADAGVLKHECAARSFGRQSLKNKDPKKMGPMAQVACNHQGVHSAVCGAYIDNMADAPEEAQSDVFAAVNSGKNTTDEHRVDLVKVISKLHEDNHKVTSEMFLLEKRNRENAHAMAVFAQQIPLLSVPIEQRTAYLNQVSSLGNVDVQVVQDVRNQLSSQYYQQTNRTDFDDFASAIGTYKFDIASTVSISNSERLSENSRKFLISSGDGFFDIAKTTWSKLQNVFKSFGIAYGSKPTISKFIEMLEKDVFTAEFVAKAGYKSVLISQFSSLNLDTQNKVLETLTIEEKVEMRKKGLLPRRFWEQVEKQVAKRVFDGGDVTNSDAALLVNSASNSVLYRCLTDSSIKLSADNRSLFEKKLLDNNYLKRNAVGQYQKA